MIVVDTNVISYLYFPSNQTEEVEKVYTKMPLWVVPFLWRSEFRNVATLYFKKGILTLDAVKEVTIRAEELLWGYEEMVDSDKVFELIKISTCSAYDCEFVALATSLNTKLITYNKKILREFSDVAINPDQFLRMV
jgi:predicted nucleic acid-binding protein